MKVFFEEKHFPTTSHLQVINITGMVRDAVEKSGVKNGLVIVHAPHATAAIVLNEHEPGLEKDILKLIEERIPYNYPWQHNLIDDNAGAHLASSVIGSTKILPVKNGEIVRGTWQEILFLELDGPRSVRRVVIEVVGEEEKSG